MECILVIFSDFSVPCKDSSARFTTVPLKPKSDQKSFSDSNCVYFCNYLYCFLSARKAQANFAEKLRIKVNSLKKQKQGYLIHTWSDKASKGTVVNRALGF